MRTTLRDTIPVMTIILRLALMMILCAVPPAFAQGGGDVIVESVEIRGANDGRKAPFAPGAPINMTIALRNGSERAALLRSLALLPSNNLVIADPLLDDLDNDGDGETDEADERFRRQKGREALLPFGEGGTSLDPGEQITRTLRIGVTGSALPGTDGAMILTTTASPSGTRQNRPRKTERRLTVAIAPATLRLTVGEDTLFETGNTAIFDGRITLPGGTLPEGRITLTLPFAMADAAVKSYRIGPAITCDEEKTPRIEADEAILRLDGCKTDADASKDDRSIDLAIAAPLTDAPSTATPAEVSDWRALSVYLGLWSGETLLNAKVMNRTMVGARLVTETTLPPRTTYRTGDPVAVDISITNQGDQTLVNPRLQLTNTESFHCKSATISNADDTVPCKDNTIQLPDIGEEDTLNLSVLLQLRRDALIDAGTGPTFDLGAKGIGTRALPVPNLTMALHDAPSLRIVDKGSWQKQGEVITATIGDNGLLRLTGTLPPGRYPGTVTLLSRAVDARTGAPVAPAQLVIPEPALSISTLDGERTGDIGGLTTKTGTLWSQYNLDFDLSDARDQADQNRRFSVDFDVTLADDLALTAGNVLEIAAETTAYGRSSVSSEGWVDILVREPDLRLKMFSLDEDRTIRPGEPFGTLSLACNYGDSNAFGVVMALDTPPAVDLKAKTSTIRALTVPLNMVRDGSPDRINEASRTLGADNLSVDSLPITLDRSAVSVGPEECIGIELRAPLKRDRSDTLSRTATALTFLKSYDSSPNKTKARRYPSARTSPLRFQMPVISLAPPATLQIDGNRQVEHLVELTVPDNLGGFRVYLSPQSSTGLDWQLLERREGSVTPWLNNASAYPPGSTIGILMRTTAPETLPLGWVDTSRLEAQVLTDEGKRLQATLRVVIRSDTSRAIATDKRVALDRDCDGELIDERVQDAVFEPVKDATPGDCIIVRIGFENAGTREVERIIIRDAISSRTTLLPESPAVRIAPEPLDSVTEPDPAGGMLEWQFRGLFRPGAVGEVEYRLRLDPQ